jgi:hypothetical protein
VKNIIFIILVAALLAGCVSPSAKIQPGAFDGVSAINVNASRQLADHAAYMLASAFPPGSTAFNVPAETDFGRSLEDSLRQRGFTITSTGAKVGYVVDFIDPSTCYIKLALPEGGRISQSYSVNADGAVSPVGVVAKSGVPDFILPISPLAQKAESKVMATPLADIETEQPAKSGSESANLPDKGGFDTPVADTPGKKPAVEVDVALAAKSEDVANVIASEVVQQAPLDIEIPIIAESIESAPVDYNSAEILAAKIAFDEEWRIAPGLLSPQLRDWSGKAGYSLVWGANHDFEMKSEAGFFGSFHDAVSQLFNGMHENGNPLRVTIYQSNRVLEVLED